tara:strand:+ start:2339 stop:2572 length:234 start_codon:yes stop_codon:yes gene_type:complete
MPYDVSILVKGSYVALPSVGDTLETALRLEPGRARAVVRTQPPILLSELEEEESPPPPQEETSIKRKKIKYVLYIEK